ncbi:unnamed protein product [Mytilus edulis]|uniref:Uncharacterized protein n=1 Tax=Mytilus edulis TaxID=6550 RepID=A0A8S3QCM4_MYTED|nr:unnamed protein product [Mytilus edulis]
MSGLCKKCDCKVSEEEQQGTCTVCLGFKECDCKDSEEEQQRTCTGMSGFLRSDCKDSWRKNKQRTCTGMSGFWRSVKMEEDNEHVQVCRSGTRERTTTNMYRYVQFKESDCKDSEEEQQRTCTGMSEFKECDCKDQEEQQRTFTGMSGVLFYAQYVLSKDSEEEQQRTCTGVIVKRLEEEITNEMYRSVIVKLGGRNNNEHVQVCLGFKKCDCKDWKKNNKEHVQVCLGYKKSDCKDSEEEQQGICTGVIVKTRRKNNNEHVQVCLGFKSVIVKIGKKNNNEHVQVCLGFKEWDCKDSEEEQQRTCTDSEEEQQGTCTGMSGFKGGDCKNSEEEQQETCTGSFVIVKTRRKNNNEHVQVCLGFKECDCKTRKKNNNEHVQDVWVSEEEQQEHVGTKDSEEEQQRTCTVGGRTTTNMYRVCLGFKCSVKTRRKNNKERNTGMSRFNCKVGGRLQIIWVFKDSEEEQQICTGCLGLRCDCKDSEEEQQGTCTDKRYTGIPEFWSVIRARRKNNKEHLQVCLGFKIVIVKTRRKNNNEHPQVCLGFKKCDCKDSEEEQKRTCTEYVWVLEV